MTVFGRHDLVPLWDRPPSFLPLRPPGGLHRWAYREVRAELTRVAAELDKGAAERRVALLAHPDLDDAAAVEGLHVGVQLLLAGESADAHRHTPAALRIGLEASDLVTMVDGAALRLDPLDVVLNPSGTWHGHEERGGTEAVWLDVVDLPLVSALGGVLFEPTTDHRTGDLLDPPSTPQTTVFPWAEVEAELDRNESIDGVRSHRYGGGSVLPTLAVTANAVEAGATLNLAAHTGGAVALVARGRFDGPLTGPLERFDVVALRGWTPLALTARDDGIVIVVDTAPALRALGLYRESATE